MTKIEFKINKLPKRINEGHGSSWRTRYGQANMWMRLIDLAVKEKPSTPFKKAKLTLIRASTRSPDYDGIVYSFKPVIDALKKLNIIEDDSMAHIGKPDYNWECAPRGKGYIHVVVEEIKPDSLSQD
jgi:Holliday junction resolvase RusA-like endonuclease